MVHGPQPDEGPQPEEGPQPDGATQPAKLSRGDQKPHVRTRLAPDRAQIPATRDSEHVTGAPLVARFVPVAAEMESRSPGQLMARSVRAERHHLRHARAGHPPDDLLLLTDAGGPRIREHQQPPQRGSAPGALHHRHAAPSWWGP